MNWQSRLATAIALSLSTVGLVGLSAQAVKLANGTTSFVQPPRLESAVATQKAARFLGSTYYFTLTVPANAGEPLRTIVISPQEAPDRVEFNLDQTETFEGTFDREGTKLPHQTVTQDAKTQAITITFDPAIAAGKTVTIGLFANRNPDLGGVYLYGVTAFPSGDQPFGQFLGYGRIQIYDGGLNS
ncbi:DUF2808 domain-containing protein [Stenomitos frigidus]|uniref:DUF2808 domain-containing protein n=1 Tax=Stenomitos frigidus ULC18 TaxID=2107698 RepID=A0A2T1EDF8_9CYAN|nr:DUF2808 domain-containing protein [Stenomitos frigidus]PSB30770.1 hypothetical protein C7B82_08115 [Stenomitos frigidus ULC18]